MTNELDAQGARVAKDARDKIRDNFPYTYAWNRPDGAGRKGQLCRVTARGTMNSCCVEFEDGFKMVTSRNALRKRK